MIDRLRFLLKTIVLLGPLLAGSSYAQAGQDLTGYWNLRLSQIQEKDETQQTNISESRLELGIDYAALNNLILKFQPTFSYRSGFEQNLENSPSARSQISVKEASVTFLFSLPGFADNISGFSLGSLDQAKNHPDLLLYQQSFPGARFFSQQDRISLEINGGIPNSQSQSTRTGELESTPGFASAILSYKKNNNLHQFSSSLGAFQFSDPSLSTATQSVLLGNSGKAQNGRDAEFIYSYSGYFLTAASEVRLFVKNYVGGKIDYLQNSQAPAGENTAYQGLIFYRSIISKNWSLRPFYHQFYAQSDASIALYNRPLIGSNRQGYRGGLDLEVQKKLTFSISSGARDAIVENPNLRRENFIYLSLETSDVQI